MKIPFDVKFRPQIECGEYKVFAHEHEEQEARIVCWDNRGEYPIVALVDNEPEKFDKYGRVPGGNLGGEFSLFIITPEPELSDFEKGCIRLYQDGRDDGLAGCYLSNKALKEIAAELLELARKEIRDEIEFRGEEYKKGYEDGKSEAEKDLPRWNKWENGACGNGRGIPLALVVRGLNGCELVDSLGIQGEKYIMLSDLKKLPGFNEGK